uniref:Uncharacterized protein MANES_15G189400 n=1 Tax=Rhizophora mucronata TaxID=61149 RepID=A0A2P2IP09_RHIMU
MLGGRGSSLRKKMMMTMNKKRKEVEDVSDDFSDFSLSSPARKIRRLEAELPPIMEEEEELEEEGGEKVGEMETVGGGIGSADDKKEQQRGLAIEEMDDGENQNQERAIVLFKPVNSYLPHQNSSALSSYSVSLDPHKIPGFQNQFPWPSQSYSRVKSMEGEEEEGEGGVSTDSMAIIPWIRSQPPAAKEMDTSQIETTSELMEAEGIGEAAMDVEDSTYNNSGSMAQGYAYSLPQWQQQHCLMPQVPPTSPSSEITWFQ